MSPSEKPLTTLGRLARSARVDRVGRMSPWALRLFRGPLRWLSKAVFRGELVGLEGLPADRPYLLVSNHSGGGAAEIGVLIAHWVEDEPRPMTGLAHPLLFHLPGFAWLLRQVGAVPSTYERARGALADGVPVLVFPGGDFCAQTFTTTASADVGGSTGADCF